MFQISMEIIELDSQHLQCLVVHHHRSSTMIQAPSRSTARRSHIRHFRRIQRFKGSI